MKKMTLIELTKSIDIHLREAFQEHFNIQVISQDVISLIELDRFGPNALIIVSDDHQATINLLREIKALPNFNYYPIFTFSNVENELNLIRNGVVANFLPTHTQTEIFYKVLTSATNHFQLSNKYNDLSFKDLIINSENQEVRYKNKQLILTSIEYRILNFLCKEPKSIIHRDKVKTFVWPHEKVLDKTLNTHLTNLRMKLSSTDIEIKSIRGKGILLDSTN